MKRLRLLTEQIGDEQAPLGRRAMALADIGEMLDHIGCHPETDSPTANLREALCVGFAESLCPALVGQLRPLWTSES